jgi:catechol 2,3-dioxygenase-like lactoylglutathione lyase family enzyme
MLTDRWDISHIGIAVPDLQQGMKNYESSFGVKNWGPLLDYSDSVDMEIGSQLHGDRVSTSGLSEIWSRHGSDIVSEAPPFAPFELACSKPFSPSYTIWGCPDGREYVHHLAYWVDDIGAEGDHLMDNGWALELTAAPGDRAKGFAYLLSPTGMRVELMQRGDKAAFGRWLESGELDLDWASEVD